MAKRLEINIGEEKNNCKVVEVTKNNKSNTIVIVKCNKCSEELRVMGYNYIRGRFMCKHGVKMLAQNFIGEDIGNLHIDNIAGYDESNRTLVNVTCNKCGSSYKRIHWHKVTSFSFLCECDKNDNYEEKSLNKYKEYIGKVKDTDEIVSVNYYKDNDSNNRCKFTVRCKICGAQREVGVLTFLDSTCYKKCNCMPKTREVSNPMKKYYDTILNKKFGLLTVQGFIEGTTLQNIVAICKCDCGNNHFETTLSNLVSGDTKSCGCRVKSWSEVLIGKTLKELGVDFTEQQQMIDLFSNKGKRLKFDFFIKNKDGLGIAVIEIDGPHHQKPFNYGHLNSDKDLDEVFKQIQENDKLKDKYVEDHGCKILRIKYKRDIADTEIINEVKHFINALNIK